MSSSFKYVKEFEFPTDKGFSGSAGKTVVKGYCRGGSVKPAYAKGGHVESKERSADAKQDKAVASKAVHKHESKMHPGKEKTKFGFGGLAGKLAKAAQDGTISPQSKKESIMTALAARQKAPQATNPAAGRQGALAAVANKLARRSVPVDSGQPLIGSGVAGQAIPNRLGKMMR